MQLALKLNASIKYLAIACCFVLLNPNLKAQSLEIGDTMPNFKVLTSHDDFVYFNQINEGYVFVNIWASWNSESRKINRDLLPVYSRYKDKRYNNGIRRFNIISISIDNNRRYYELAIKKDNPAWQYKHCDFLGWDSPVIELLLIKRIPANFLVDPNGRIIGKNLSSKELELLLRSL